MVGLCRLFGVSKQAYYKTVNHVFERSVLKHFIIEYVQGVRSQSPGTGGEKLWLMYQSFLVHDLLVTHPNQVWVSDITYIRTGEGFCFLSLVTDAYTHEIIGWKVGKTLEQIILKVMTYRLV